MASLTRWTWGCASSKSWLWTGKPGLLPSMGSQRVRHNWATELNWIISDVEYLLYAFWPSVCLLWRNFYSDLPLSFWLGCLCFWYLAAWCVCIFWRLIPCWLLHLQIFSPNLRVVFSFCLCFPLLCRKFLSLVKYHLFIFVLFSLIYEVDHKSSCCNLCQSILPRFSSKSFIVSDLTFRPVIHFEFIFCIWY